MNRCLALVVSVVAGGFLAYGAVLVTAGAMLGFLWLYVFGDAPWPSWTETVLGPAIVLAGFLLWAFVGWTIWLRLRRR
ncbi:MAG TPA: hypothetical protein VNA29_09130 [Sphingomicrobium sp.]|nr:hypothetical protein [Sphingomicrobium sp.]